MSPLYQSLQGGNDDSQDNGSYYESYCCAQCSDAHHGTGRLRGGGSSSSADNSQGRVYYLNKKAEEQESWVKLGQQFEKETGIPVQIQVAANYDETLRSEMAKKEAPTMFQADGPSFMNQWKAYAADMSQSDLYKNLSDDYKNRVLNNDDGKPISIPYAVESYGIIYNKALLNKYFESSWSSVKSIDELNNFKALKAAADEIQEHKDEMGVKGAFSSPGMDGSSSFRFFFHLPTVPLFYEYKQDGVDMNTVPASVKGTYVKNMKNIWDLYITDTTVEPSTISGKTMDDSTAEFATGQAVFFQDGVWIYNQLKGQSVADEDLGVLPIYIGVKGEEKQGLNQVISNYWVVNSKASQADQQATHKFLSWLITNDKARKTISQDMGLVTPFTTFDDPVYQVNNPLVNANREYQDKGFEGVVNVPNPSHQWEQDLGGALLNYTQGNGGWDAVTKVFTDNWAKEYKLSYAQ